MVVLCLVAGSSFGVGLRLSAAPPEVRLASGVPTELTPAELRRYASDAGRELYWLGPVAGRKLEVTEAGAKGIFVRYLPSGQAVGAESATFTTIATYPVQGAYRIALRSARREGAVSEGLAAGGVAVWRRDRPTSVYVAYPGSGALVEIFQPDRSKARALARSGRVAPIG